ncbi:MAG: hypothetical protein AAGC45_00940 [Bacteroidota bacterium]
MELFGTPVFFAALAPVLVIVQALCLNDIASIGRSTDRGSDEHFQWKVFIIERIFLWGFTCMEQIVDL